MRARPRVGISRCLLGIAVRYDGGHKLEPSLIDTLGRDVEWVDVCPEIEVGMGVPREPVRLVSAGAEAGAHGVRMITVQSGHDWTARMTAWSEARLRDLASMHLSGFVLKAGSPSCGLRDVPVQRAGSPDAPPLSRGRGLFAEALVAACPGLPVEDEEQLRNADVARAFFARVRAFYLRPSPGTS